MGRRFLGVGRMSSRCRNVRATVALDPLASRTPDVQQANEVGNALARCHYSMRRTLFCGVVMNRLRRMVSEMEPRLRRRVAYEMRNTRRQFEAQLHHAREYIALIPGDLMNELSFAVLLDGVGVG
jgi:hypothetical protein